MSKTVPIKPNPRKKQSAPEANPFDAFVGVKGESPLAQPPQRMKRLTFDIPADLHKRIRLACVEKEEDMAAELRRILLEHFPS
jgi:hypothetical protein